jgi:hypothetical protein
MPSWLKQAGQLSQRTPQHLLRQMKEQLGAHYQIEAFVAIG